MIVDSSAIAAALFDEADAPGLIAAMRHGPCLMSAATYVEISMVIDGKNDPALSAGLDRFVETMGVTVVPFTPRQARLAREAFRRYGRGSGHPARLDLGDCMSYAASTDLGEPLLYKGDDFPHTDVVPAL